MTTILAGHGARLLRHIPRDADSRPRVVASATYEIEDLRYSEDSDERPIGSGAATVGKIGAMIDPIAQTANALKMGAKGVEAVTSNALGVTTGTGKFGIRVCYTD